MNFFVLIRAAMRKDERRPCIRSEQATVNVCHALIHRVRFRHCRQRKVKAARGFGSEKSLGKNKRGLGLAQVS
jgi:hypothetical protein